MTINFVLPRFQNLCLSYFSVHPRTLVEYFSDIGNALTFQFVCTVSHEEQISWELSMNLEMGEEPVDLAVERGAWDFEEFCSVRDVVLTNIQRPVQDFLLFHRDEFIK